MKLISIITKHLPLVTAAILMAACASEDFVGNKELHEANENGRPVSFGIVAAPQTRAVYGGEAASLLNNNFVVGKFFQRVFDRFSTTIKSTIPQTLLTLPPPTLQGGTISDAITFLME